MEDIFCEILHGEEPRGILFETENVVVIPDKFPKAEQHYLIIPKKHIQSIMDSTEEDMNILGEMLLVAKNFAKERNISDYRLIFNAGKYVVVPHLHLHLIVGHLPPNP
jgi:histidine triad (HIT) family protein